MTRQLRELAALVRAEDRAIESAIGLPANQLRLLAIVRREPGTRVSAIARRLALDVSTISNLIRNLSDKGLLRSAADPLDRRARLVFPRPAAARYQRSRPGERRTAAEPLQPLLRALTARQLAAIASGLAVAHDKIPWRRSRARATALRFGPKPIRRAGDAARR